MLEEIIENESVRYERDTVRIFDDVCVFSSPELAHHGPSSHTVAGSLSSFYQYGLNMDDTTLNFQYFAKIESYNQSHPGKEDILHLSWTVAQP